MSLSLNSVPVLPLRDIVVFPNVTTPLFVGREKSINALDFVMGETKKILLLAQKMQILIILKIKIFTMLEQLPKFFSC